MNYTVPNSENAVAVAFSKTGSARHFTISVKREGPAMLNSRNADSRICENKEVSAVIFRVSLWPLPGKHNKPAAGDYQSRQNCTMIGARQIELDSTCWSRVNEAYDTCISKAKVLFQIKMRAAQLDLSDGSKL